jgi:sugar phosphate isomerase/epimerase
MPSNRLRLSVVAHALSADPRVAPRLAREYGFEGVLFDAVSPALDLTQLSGTGKREFRSVVSGQNQQLVGLRMDLLQQGFSLRGDVDRELSRLEKAMDAAKGLQAPLVCVDLGPLPEPAREAKPRPTVTAQQAGLILIPGSMDLPKTPEPPAVPPPDPSFVSQVDAAMVELGRRADRCGVMLAMRAELASFAALERALRAADCPYFGIDLDPVAVLRDVWDVDEVFSRLGPLIRHVRGRDAVAGADRRTKPAVVGAGGTDWGQLLARLDEAGYHGWVTLDPVDLSDRVAAAIAGRQHLKSFLAPS